MAMWGIKLFVRLQLRVLKKLQVFVISLGWEKSKNVCFCAQLWKSQVSVTFLYWEKSKNRVKIALFKILHKKQTFLDFSQPTKVTET